MAFINADENYPKSGEQRTLLTITGDSAVLDGKFKISQSIEIDCELRGKLTVDKKLTIRQNGFVSADVKTIEAEIIGKYEGNMEATGNVEIKETGFAMGNIKTDSLIINKGGIFSGNVTRISEEQAEGKKKAKSGKAAKEETEFETENYSREDYRASSEDESESTGSGSEDEENLSL